jgi:hypothetical protein
MIRKLASQSAQILTPALLKGRLKSWMMALAQEAFARPVHQVHPARDLSALQATTTTA